jgi:hypothetical protein
MSRYCQIDPRTVCAFTLWVACLTFLAVLPGKAAAQCEQREFAKLTASDAVSIAAFVYSVTVSGNFVVVGTTYNNSTTGAAYVYRFNGTTRMRSTSSPYRIAGQFIRG